MQVMRSLVSIALLPLLWACAPRGPLTPEDAMNALRTAYRSGDAAAVENILSHESLDRIDGMCRIFASMPPERLAAISREYGIPVTSLSSLSRRNAVILFMYMEPGGNTLRTSLKGEPLGVDRRGKCAVFRMSDGVEITFVLEGPYWKLDITGL